MAQQLLSAGLALSSIWEKARARDRQRDVAGDKGQWALSARDETSCGSVRRMVARGRSYHQLNCLLFFSFIHMCIQCLGHFSPLAPTPSFTPTPSPSPPHPCYQVQFPTFNNLKFNTQGKIHLQVLI
jgi:hypothetical protein